MSSFVVQSQKYDSQEVESTIEDLQKELQDEIEIAETLDNTTADKIAAAKQFVSDNADKISVQLATLQDLQSKITDAVNKNENLESLDEEYKGLVSSESYVALADQIASIKSISADLINFLVKQGRRGRPASSN
ncbi:MAG TPA: hypothetical protein PKD85_15585 [Saprospiraceae bacterium]|nr:hypothetical protein [Saprospiraceae bacterium]